MEVVGMMEGGMNLMQMKGSSLGSAKTTFKSSVSPC